MSLRRIFLSLAKIFLFPEPVPVTIPRASSKDLFMTLASSLRQPHTSQFLSQSCRFFVGFKSG